MEVAGAHVDRTVRVCRGAARIRSITSIVVSMQRASRLTFSMAGFTARTLRLPYLTAALYLMSLVHSDTHVPNLLHVAQCMGGAYSEMAAIIVDTIITATDPDLDMAVSTRRPTAVLVVSPRESGAAHHLGALIAAGMPYSVSLDLAADLVHGKAIVNVAASSRIDAALRSLPQSRAGAFLLVTGLDTLSPENVTAANVLMHLLEDPPLLASALPGDGLKLPLPLVVYVPYAYIGTSLRAADAVSARNVVREALRTAYNLRRTSDAGSWAGHREVNPDALLARFATAIPLTAASGHWSSDAAWRELKDKNEACSGVSRGGVRTTGRTMSSRDLLKHPAVASALAILETLLSQASDFIWDAAGVRMHPPVLVACISCVAVFFVGACCLGSMARLLRLRTAHRHDERRRVRLAQGSDDSPTPPEEAPSVAHTSRQRHRSRDASVAGFPPHGSTVRRRARLDAASGTRSAAATSRRSEHHHSSNLKVRRRSPRSVKEQESPPSGNEER